MTAPFSLFIITIIIVLCLQVQETGIVTRNAKSFSSHQESCEEPEFMTAKKQKQKSRRSHGIEI